MSTKQANAAGYAAVFLILLAMLGLLWGTQATSPAPVEQSASIDEPQDERNDAPESPAPSPQSPAPKAFFGYVPNPQGTQQFLRQLPRPLIRQAGPDLFRYGVDDRPVLLYRALYKAYAATHGGQEWRVGAQGIGDCVSWGWAHGCDVHLAVMWQLGHTSEWHAAATESIYGGSRVEARGVSRGGYSDGSYGGAAAKWVRDWGVIFRQPYPSFAGLDLTTYSASRAKQWGNFGNGGESDDGQLDQEAKRHPVRNVALVRSFQEAAAAIAAGYPVPVCSGRGFSSQRDGQGFSRPSGSWSHCMCFTAVRFDRPGLLCQNSWGTSWIGGPKWPEDQPDGSFWVDADVATGMLSGGDSFAVSGYEGFPYRKLNHADWSFVDPESCRRFAARLHHFPSGERQLVAD